MNIITEFGSKKFQFGIGAKPPVERDILKFLFPPSAGRDSFPRINLKTILATGDRKVKPCDLEAAAILDAILLQHDIDLRKGRLIEFGAGDGNFTRVFRSLNNQFTAYDITRDVVDDDLVANGTIQIGDGIAALAKMPSNSVDTVVAIMFGPLIGTPYGGEFDIAAFLTEVNRVLTPNGQFIAISDLNTISIMEGDAYKHIDKLLKAIELGATTTPLAGIVLRKKEPSDILRLILKVLSARLATYRLIIDLASPHVCWPMELLSRLMHIQAGMRHCRPEDTPAGAIFRRRQAAEDEIFCLKENPIEPPNIIIPYKIKNS